MSRPALSIPPVLAFADLDGGRWGVAAGSDPAQVAVASSDGAGPVAPDAGELARNADGEWSLGDGAGALTAVEQSPPVTTADVDPRLRLVRASATAQAGGIAYPGEAELQADSARMLFAWFPEERAVGMLAVRPARSKGQDRDELSVACLGEPEDQHIFDPRLSSTYRDGGLLRRVGVELWLGASEEADLRSLRVAGEAGPSVARLELPGTLVQAQPFRAYSRDQVGIGVYVLITRS